MTKRLLLVFFLLNTIFSAAAVAQGLPGYVVTLNGDTVRGFVAETDAQRIAFYKQPGAVPQYFRPGRIRAYGLGPQTVYTSRLARLRSGRDSLRFVRPLLLGPASLYSASSDSVKLLLHSPATDTLYELTAYNWNLLFNRHLRGCPDLDFSDVRILSQRFEARILQALVVRYNQCVRPDWKPVRPTTSTLQRRLTLTGGTIAYAAYAAPQLPAEAENRRDPGLTFGAELRLLHSSGWWISGGLALQHLRGGSKPFSIYTGSSVIMATRTETFDLRQVLLHGNLGRSFGQPGRFRPFIFTSAGLGTCFNSQTRTEVVYSAILPSSYQQADRSGQTVWQAALGAGGWLPLGPRYDLQFSMSYGQNIFLTSPTLRTHLLTVQTGLLLPAW